MNSKKQQKTIYVDGIPSNLSESKQALYHSRFSLYAQDLMQDGNLNDLQVVISTTPNVGLTNSEGIGEKLKKLIQEKNQEKPRDNDEMTTEQRAQQYSSQKPLYGFDFLVVPDEVMQNLMLAVSLIELEHKVFDEWGLRRIEPFPRTALNFHGEPGTGKTLAAHSIASFINAPIMVASYAQIESKYHGEGPKNVEALFYAAERDKAVLFIDEADSLLSKRLTNVTQGSEQAINSMRSQLLICLEKFKGVVIFSTNLIKNYDKAFETRVRSVLFPMPDEACRRKIWAIHLGDGTQPPLKDVDLMSLAKVEDMCGRDIKNALIDAALNVAKTKDFIEQQDLISAVERVKAARIKHNDEMPKPIPADKDTSEKILAAIESQNIPRENTASQAQ